MSTFNSGAGVKLAAGLQKDYFDNRGTTTANACTVDTKLNITSATFDPTVEKGSEETLLQSKVKNGSYLLSIGMEGSFDANLRPEMTDWLFKAVTQNATCTEETHSDDPNIFEGYTRRTYTLKAAGNDPLGSSLVFTKKDNQVFTYPGMTVRSMTLNAPNNDFVTVSCDMVGREEIVAGGTSKISTTTSYPITHYISKSDTSEDYTKASYIVTNGVFLWNDQSWCIEGATLTIDNGIEDSPRCYQDGKFANIPVMGIRSITLDFNTPYTDLVENCKNSYLLSSQYGSAKLIFANPDVELADEHFETVEITIPNLSITSVGSGVSGTGVIEASISGEAVQVGSDEPITIAVTTKDPE